MSWNLFLYCCMLIVLSIDAHRVAKVTAKTININIGRRRESPPNDDKMREISGNLNSFSFKLYNSLARNSDPKRNVVFSPFSIFTVFSAVCLGANGETKKEMVRALNWGYDEKLLKFIHPWYMLISRTKRKSAKLFIANKAWVSNDTKLLLGYRKIMKTYFHIKFRKIDVTKPEVSLKAMNTWVARKTRDMIPELFPPGIINSHTKLVLANAIYFKGKWANKFDKEETEKGVFCVGDDNGVCDTSYENGGALGNGRVEVDYMTKKAVYPTGYASGATVLEIPYAGGLLSMYFILPDSNSNINILQKQMNPKILEEMISNLANETVIISVPKFKIKHEIDLDGNTLNMQHLFNANKADLSFINGVTGLYVSKAVHKTHFKVDEAGTAAASITGVHMQLRSRTPEIRLNRPFLFYVIHKKCGAIIFSGKVMNPNL